MPDETPVLVKTEDMFFRAKLEAVIRDAGGSPTREGAVSLAVVDVRTTDPVAIRALVSTGTRVIAFGPHTEAGLLRGARDAGATAVPNSRLEETVRGVLDYL